MRLARDALAGVAVVATVFGLAHAASASAGSDDSSTFVVGQVTATTAPATTPAVDSGPASAVVTDAGPATLTQQLSVTVVPGPLTVAPTTSVELHRRGDGAYEGDVDAVRVVDARGSLAGWAVTTTVSGASADLDGASILFEPAPPSVVYGDDTGLAAAPVARLVPGAAAPFFSAAPGDGGGTFEDGAHITLQLPHDTGADTVTLTLSSAVS